jgi:uncharacterized glyoxalase superfamily protein PhnB
VRGAEVNVIPFLGYEDVRAAIDWLAKAFGFEEVAAHEGDDGQVVHAELRFGDGMVMLGRPGPSFGMKTPGELGAVSGGIYSIVDDGLEAHYERAIAAGAEVVMELHDTDYGSREYMVRDPEGNLWSFGTYRPE